MWRQKTDRERYVEAYRPERMRRVSLRGDVGPADLKKTTWLGHGHLCNTGMPEWNGKCGTDRNTIQKRMQVCDNNWVR